MYGEVIEKLQLLEERIRHLRDMVKLERSEKRLLELETAMAEQGFWDKRNSEKAHERASGIS